MFAQIMHEAAEEARESNRAATERFFRQLKQDAKKIQPRGNEEMSAFF